MGTEQTNIIVCGANGRMGRVIIDLALGNEKFRVAGAVERSECLQECPKLDCPVTSDYASLFASVENAVVIDFTAPKASLEHASCAAGAKLPIVIGTTGLDASQKKELAALAQTTPILWSANMSIGVNALLVVLPLLAGILGPNYDMEIMEIHHKHKKDAPSGTALMLEQALAQARGWEADEVRISGRAGMPGERKKEEIGVHALRGGDVAGVHSCYFFGPGEIIEVKHVAESRENFAQGALRAAAWLKNMPAGALYSMKDALNIS